MIHIFLLFFLLVTLLGNFLLTYLFPAVGIVVNSITILGYLIFASYDIYDLDAQDVFSLSATFLLINLITVYLHFSGIYINSLITYLLLLFIALIFCLKIFHEKRLFRLKNIVHIYIIIPIGILFGFAAFYFMSFSQFASLQISPNLALPIIILIGIAESIFFQALLQNAIASMTDTFIAITFTSILYGVFHFSTNIFTTLLFMILSLVYCVTYTVTKNIYISIGLNVVINITFYILTSNLLIFAVR